MTCDEQTDEAYKMKLHCKYDENLSIGQGDNTWKPLSQSDSSS